VDQGLEGSEIFLKRLIATNDRLMTVFLQFFKMHAQLFHTDGLVIGDPFFVSIIDPLETVIADPTIEFAVVIISNELEGLSVLEAVIEAHIHVRSLTIFISLLKAIIYFNLIR
jgi:hypothetical protein